MQQFIEKYADQILGSLSGFDRLVFRGSLRRLNIGYWDTKRRVQVAKGMEEYLWQNKIQFKDYARHVKRVSERLKEAALQPFRQQGLPVIFLRSTATDKDALARAIAAERSVRQGLVCAISSLEPSPTFEHCGINIIRRERPCHVLCHYQIHPQVGWCYARVQTWFPFNIQIGINGREWLARQMDQAGLAYRQQGNCFVWVEDYAQTQQLLDAQLKTNWAELLDGFGQQLHPTREQVFEHYPTDYYWTTFQSEWATDITFRKGEDLKRLMPLLVPHATLTYASADVLRFFGQRVNQSGAIPARFHREVKTDLREYREGERVKYTLGGNSVKFYDKAYSESGQVLRAAETTINRVAGLREYRAAEGGPAEDLQWRPLRKGVAGLYRRAEISQHTNQRLLDALASVDDSRTVEELTAAIQTATRWNGRRVRGLRPRGEDQDLLAAINRGDFLITGLRNRDLQKLLYTTEPASPIERRRRSAAVSRKLRMLRSHGLIQKVPRTHRYQVQGSARPILAAILTTARTSVHQLNQLVGKAA